MVNLKALCGLGGSKSFFIDAMNAWPLVKAKQWQDMFNYVILLTHMLLPNFFLYDKQKLKNQKCRLPVREGIRPPPALLDYPSTLLWNKGNLFWSEDPFFKNIFIQFFILNKQFPDFSLGIFLSHIFGICFTMYGDMMRYML